MNGRASEINHVISKRYQPLYQIRRLPLKDEKIYAVVLRGGEKQELFEKRTEQFFCLLNEIKHSEVLRWILYIMRDLQALHKRTSAP